MRCTFRLLAPLMLMLMLILMLSVVAGCTSPTASLGTRSLSGAAPSVPATSTVTVPRTSIAAPVRTDITASLRNVQKFVTGSLWTGGRVPGKGDIVPIPAEEAFVNGRLSFTETVGRTGFSRSTQVTADRMGAPDTIGLTIRSTSTDPRTTVDVLHRNGNAKRDYLLTGDGYRAAAPTPWVTVPAQFGNGAACVLPGRATVCQVVADLLANQRLSPSMPTNTTADKGGTTTIRSAITVRQLLVLDSWRLKREAGPALLAKASRAEVDQTLIPVTIGYVRSAAHRTGRPISMLISGRVSIAGTALAIDLNWSEKRGTGTTELTYPVPTRALYTPLDAKQAKRLTQLIGQSR